MSAVLTVSQAGGSGEGAVLKSTVMTGNRLIGRRECG